MAQVCFPQEGRPKPPAWHLQARVCGCIYLLALRRTWAQPGMTAQLHSSICSPALWGDRQWLCPKSPGSGEVGTEEKKSPLGSLCTGPISFFLPKMYRRGGVAWISFAELTQAVAPRKGQWVNQVVGLAGLTNSCHGQGGRSGKARDLLCQGRAASQEGHQSSWTWMGSVDVDFGDWDLCFRCYVKKVRLVQRYK